MTIIKRNQGKSFVFSQFSITFDLLALLSWPLTPIGHQRCWFGTQIYQFDSTIWDFVVETSICRDRDRVSTARPASFPTHPLARRNLKSILVLHDSWTGPRVAISRTVPLVIVHEMLKVLGSECLHALPAAEPLSQKLLTNFPLGINKAVWFRFWPRSCWLQGKTSSMRTVKGNPNSVPGCVAESERC